MDAIMRRVRLAVLVLSASACGGGGLSDSDAHQIAPGRDFQITSAGNPWWGGDRVVFARGSLSSDMQLWMYRLGEDEPELLDRGSIDYWWFVKEPDGTARAVAVAFPGSFAIHPFDGSPRIDIAGVDTTIGVLRPSRCVLARIEGLTERLIAGPCDNLQPLAPELDVVMMVDGGDGHVVVTARRGGATVLGIYDVAPDGTITELVAPQLGEHDTPPGTTPLEPLESATVYGDMTLVRECWDGNCHLVYRRKMADGTLRPFVYRHDTRREVSLPGDRFSYELWRWWFYPGNPRLVLWAMGEGERSQLSVWNLETDTVKSCSILFRQSSSSPLPGVAWRPDGGAFMVRGGSTSPDGVTVVSTGAEPCASIDMALAYPSFAPDGAGMVWWTNAAIPTGAASSLDVWAADGAGGHQRKVLTVPDLFTAEMIAGNEILIRFGVLDGAVLASVRTDVEPAVSRPLASQVFGETVSLGGRKLLTGTAMNADDASGNLSTIDLDSGDRRDLDTAVTWYIANESAALYSVQGRYASSRDGLWVRRLQ